MQTLHQQAIALNRRAHAAQDAIKTVERLKKRIETKEGEIAGVLPDATGPAANLREKLNKQLAKLKEDHTAAVAAANVILDLSTPFNPTPSTPVVATAAEPAATGTEGGETGQPGDLGGGE